MNARELLDRMKANRVIVSNDDWQIIESALALLAAAEANDGTTPIADAGMRAAAAMANEHMSRHVTSGVLELRDAILAEAEKP